MQSQSCPSRTHWIRQGGGQLTKQFQVAAEGDKRVGHGLSVKESFPREAFHLGFEGMNRVGEKGRHSSMECDLYKGLCTEGLGEALGSWLKGAGKGGGEGR